MLALIDGDIVVYSNAASAENDPVEVAYMRIDQMMHSILDTTGSDTFRVFLSGSNNFRHEIYPEYKANRKDLADPRWRSACKEYLVREWDAEVTDGYEADDALGINQDKQGHWELGEHSPLHNTIICTIDKDLDMIPGMHYSWPIVRKGEVVREGRIYEVSEIEAVRSFYTSLYVGDRVDNIFGIAGVGKVGAGKKLNSLQTEKEMFDIALNDYLQVDGHTDRFIMNAKCLWILRNEEEDIVSRWKRLEFAGV